MKAVYPREVLERVAAAVPPDCHPRMIIIGSLAAGYHLLSGRESIPVRTKDVDCVLSPRIEAVHTARAMVSTLLESGWKPRPEVEFQEPGTADTPDERLPAIRLNPPGTNDWFIELLVVPAPGDAQGRRWTRIVLESGHFGLPSFEFLSVATHDAAPTEFNLRCARPEMMVLAHLLEHPDIKPDTIRGTETKRSNKDLARVLAIARLSREGEILDWPARWEQGLRAVSPDRWRSLSTRAGTGLRMLLESPEDLEQAVAVCNAGLLASQPVRAEELRLTGRRLLLDALEPFKGRGTLPEAPENRS